jgi:hypothetical protein
MKRSGAGPRPARDSQSRHRAIARLRNKGALNDCVKIGAGKPAMDFMAVHQALEKVRRAAPRRGVASGVTTGVTALAWPENV